MTNATHAVPRSWRARVEGHLKAYLGAHAIAGVLATMALLWLFFGLFFGFFFGPTRTIFLAGSGLLIAQRWRRNRRRA